MQMPIIILSGKARAGKDTAAKIIAETLGGTVLSLADPIKRFCINAFELKKEQLWGDQKEQSITIKKQDPTVLVDAFVDAIQGGTIDSLDEVDLIEAMAHWMAELPEKTTPRHIMQTFGTECIRALHPGFWTRFGLDVAEGLLDGSLTYDPVLGALAPDDDESERPANVVVIPDGRFRDELLGVKQAGGLCVRVIRPEQLTGAAAKHASEQQQTGIPDWWFDFKLMNDRGLADFSGLVGNFVKGLAGSVGTYSL